MAKKTKKNGPCETVARGGVGESGASSLVIHQLSTDRAKLMVLRTVNSSLCPNTGAAAALVVDGVLEAAGVITAVGASIQAEAGPTSTVIGIVQTFPLFNEIHCIRLGELEFELQECDFVTAADRGTTKLAGPVAYEPGEDDGDWHAWADTMPPKPDWLHVTGVVQVANPGVDVQLVRRGRKGNVLELELFFHQRPGMWPQVLVQKPVRYDQVITGKPPKTVEIYSGDEKIETLEVQIVT